MAAMAGYQILSGFVQADAVRKQAEIQAQIDEFNAQLAEYDAWKVQGYGQEMIARYQSQLDQVGGTTRVAAAVKGIDIKDGSASEIIAENQLTGYMNKIDLDNRTYEQAMGYKRQASQIRLGSAMNQITSNAMANNRIAAGFMQGAGTAASGWMATQGTSTIPTQNMSTDYQLNSSGSHPWGISLMPGGY